MSLGGDCGMFADSLGFLAGTGVGVVGEVGEGERELEGVTSST